MAEPRHAKTTARGRRYSWRGEQYWSVTTIINGGTSKDILINWAKKYTAEYAIDNRAKLDALLEPDASGFVDREGAVDWLKNASFRDRDRKGKLGSEVHEAIEAYVLGRPFPPWAEEIRPRMQAFERFLARYEPDYDQGMTEAEVFSRSQRYAGTLDTVFDIGRGPHKGRRVLNDYKSGGKDVYPESALQLAAYRRAEFVAGADGSEQPMPEVDLTTVLWLPAAGEAELVEVDTSDEIFRAFLYVREVYRWHLETSQRAVLGPVKWEGEPAPEEQLALAAMLAGTPGTTAAPGVTGEPGVAPVPLSLDGGEA